MVASSVACVTHVLIANSEDVEFENKDARKEHRAGLPKSDTVGWSVAGDAQTAKERGSTNFFFGAHRKSLLEKMSKAIARCVFVLCGGDQLELIFAFLKTVRGAL